MVSLQAQMSSSRLKPEFTDITANIRSLHESLKHEEPTKIFKSSLFDLFTSTSALEVGNESLDPSTIKVSKDEIFDTKTNINDIMDRFGVENKEECIYEILDYIFRSFMQWIHDNGSLATNFISIGYVSEVLDFYNKNIAFITTFDSGDFLIDDLLRHFVITLIFIVKAIGSNEAINFVVLEEEDIRLDSLGLNFFTEHEYVDYKFSGLKSCMENVKNEKLGSLCRLVYALGEFLITNINTEYIDKDKILNFDDLRSAFDQFCESKTTDVNKYNVLKNVHSQRVFTNSYPKKQIHRLETNGYEVLGNIINNFEKTIDVLNKNKSTDTIKLTEDLYYLFTNSFSIGYDDSEGDQIKADSSVLRMNVLNRIFLFQRLISASEDLALNQVGMMQYITNDVKSLILIDEDTQKVLLNGGEGAPEELQNELQSLKQVYFDSFLNMMRNPCLYRKSLSKQLLIWDSAQANISMFEQPQNSDIENNLDDYPAISLWVYYKKMDAMIEFLLRGFGENLYSEWEYFAIYWNTFCIIDEKINLLSQFRQYNELCKKRYEKQNQSKNLKKKYKDIEKRTKIKERNLNYIKSTEGILSNISNLIIESETISLMCFLQCNRYIHLLDTFENKSNVVKHLESVNSTYIYDVRFKTFSSIGSPELPKRNTNLVLSKLLEKNNSKEYINDCLEKLKLNKKRLEAFTFDNQEKMMFWNRIFTTIDSFLDIYSGHKLSLNSEKRGIDFFKVENSHKSKTHEYFPTLI